MSLDDHGSRNKCAPPTSQGLIGSKRSPKNSDEGVNLEVFLLKGHIILY